MEEDNQAGAEEEKDEWVEEEKRQGMDDENEANMLGDDEEEEAENGKKTWSAVVRGSKAITYLGEQKHITHVSVNKFDPITSEYESSDEEEGIMIKEVIRNGKVIQEYVEKPPGLKRIKHSKPNTQEQISKCIGTLNMMEDEEDHRVMSNTNEDKWEWEEIKAVVDSGSVDMVINAKRLPGHKIIQTEDSKNGSHWTCAGSTKIAKQGMVKMSWLTNDNAKMRTEMMVGEVGKTLVSTHRLEELGWDSYLTKVNPRIVNRTTGEVIKLQKIGRLHYLSMWVRVNRGMADNIAAVAHVDESGNKESNDRQVRVFRRPVTVHR